MKELFLITILLAGCSPYVEVRSGFYCPETVKRKITDFIINCANAANPMSDEEGEDLVYGCASIAEKIYCYNQPHIYYRDVGHNYQRILPCNKAATKEEKDLCASVGYKVNK